MKQKCQRLGMVFLLAMTVTGLFPDPGVACSCIKPPGAEKEMAKADAVFRGEVTSIEEKEMKSASHAGQFARHVQLDVSKVWKGSRQESRTIVTGMNSADCGYSFEKGQEYMVYAAQSNMYSSSEQLTVTICSRTTEWSAAEEDVAVLGEPVADLKKSQSTHLTSWLLIAAVLAAAGLAAGALLGKKKTS